jgi:hypothetical protein
MKMSEENVFQWNTDALYREGIAEIPKWARGSGGCVDPFSNPEIVPKWIRGDYQIGYELHESDCFTSTALILYVRVKYPRERCSKWMPYIHLMPRDFYLLPEIVEYLLSGNAERVYETFVRERRWKNQRTGE